MSLKPLVFMAACLLASCGGKDQPSGGGENQASEPINPDLQVAISKADFEINQRMLKVGDTHCIALPPLYFQYKGLKYNRATIKEISKEDAANALEFEATLFYGAEKRRSGVRLFNQSAPPKWEAWFNLDPSREILRFVVRRIKGKWSIDHSELKGEKPSEEDVMSFKEP